MLGAARLPGARGAPGGHQHRGRMRRSFSGGTCRKAREPRSGGFSLQRDAVKGTEAQPGLWSPRAKPVAMSARCSKEKAEFGSCWLPLAPAACRWPWRGQSQQPLALRAPVTPCCQHPLQQHVVSVTSCSGCGMGQKPLSLVSRCHRMVLLLVRESLAAALAKKAQGRAGISFASCQSCHHRKRSGKSWQAGRWKGSEETVWGCCWWVQPCASPQALAHLRQWGAVGASVGQGAACSPQLTSLSDIWRCA